ncbi:phage antirepressor N-terminal domain-containing protein [Oceanospirillum beijerinckii]|uniref:phage antirepressor N-terminal domain-containing protein n=1 Tax=Oceanospirillum beijerinckii TaxID=64976 RepID=UPI00068724B6|nr:phage antirepressor N-terminal domain-containing protein [Oceanospirillum beijerinckii]
MAIQISTVDFHGQPLSVIPKNNQLYVAMKPICENIGLQWRAQNQRIQRDEVLSSTACMMHAVAEDGKNRQLLCLPVEYLNGWLFGVDEKRVKPEIKQRLIQYKKECYKVLSDYWQNGGAVNPRCQPKQQVFGYESPLEINIPVEYLGRRCLTVGDIERIHSRPGYVMDKFRQLLGQGHFEYGRHYFLLSIRADGMDRIGVADGPAEYVLTVTGYQMLMAGVDMALVERVIAEYFSVGALESTEPAEIAYYAEAFRLLQVWQQIQQIEDGAERVVQILDWEGQVNGHLSAGVQGGRFARQAEADALLVRFVRLLAGGTGSPQENVRQMGDFQMKALSWSERHRLLH